MAGSIKYVKDGNYVVVQSGNNLSQIFAYGSDNGYTTAKNYQELADWNNIKNPDKIYIGNKIYFSKGGGGSSSTSGSSSKPAVNKVVIDKLYKMVDGKNLFVSWSWGKHNDTEKYRLEWSYKLPTGEWIYNQIVEHTVDKDSPTYSKQKTQQIQANAVSMSVRIKPVAIKDKDGDKETPRFSDPGWSEWKTWKSDTLLTAPSAPTVEFTDIEDNKHDRIRATVSGLSTQKQLGATTVLFEIAKDGKIGTKKDRKSATIDDTNTATTIFSVEPGHEYNIRCYVYKTQTSGQWSDWSEWSNSLWTRPLPPKNLEIVSTSKDLGSEDTYRIRLSWSESKTATEYEAQYVWSDTAEDLDLSDRVSSKTGIVGTECLLENLESSNYKFHIRVRAKNTSTDNDGYSDWTEPVSIAVGQKPAAPTIWSSTSKATIGDEPIELYWTHNSKDNSKETWANVIVIFRTPDPNEEGKFVEVEKANLLLQNTASDENKDKTQARAKINMQVSSETNTPYAEIELIDLIYTDNGQNKSTFHLGQISEGVEIKWKVATKGIVDEFGDFSDDSLITVYAKPTLDITPHNFGVIKDEEDNIVNYLVTAFPFSITADPGPRTQKPIGYHVEIISKSDYETVDNIGNALTVSAGDSVCSKYFDANDIQFEVAFGPTDVYENGRLTVIGVDLNDTAEYELRCMVVMDSGLSTTVYLPILVDWDEISYEPSAHIIIHEDRWSASIIPVMENFELCNYEVVKSGTKYECVPSEDETDPYYPYVNLGSIEGTRVRNATITIGDTTYNIFKATSAADGEEVLFAADVLKTDPVKDVWFAIYRREYNGAFTKIEEQIDGSRTITIEDPHPSLDYARYRVVATHKATGNISYYDVPAKPVGCVAAIIQWDESMSTFDITDEDTSTPEENVRSGSILQLPYNIDVSDSFEPEVEMINYIGRSHPVGYYGTQRGHTSTWSMEIDKKDKETLYGLRRLSNWMGDVYVREPSGSGYWAHVTVSFSQTHLETTIPITLNITRVEGGI